MKEIKLIVSVPTLPMINGYIGTPAHGQQVTSMLCQSDVSM